MKCDSRIVLAQRLNLSFEIPELKNINDPHRVLMRGTANIAGVVLVLI